MMALAKRGDVLAIELGKNVPQDTLAHLIEALERLRDATGIGFVVLGGGVKIASVPPQASGGYFVPADLAEPLELPEGYRIEALPSSCGGRTDGWRLLYGDAIVSASRHRSLLVRRARHYGTLRRDLVDAASRSGGSFGLNIDRDLARLPLAARFIALDNPDSHHVIVEITAVVDAADRHLVGTLQRVHFDDIDSASIPDGE